MRVRNLFRSVRSISTWRIPEILEKHVTKVSPEGTYHFIPNENVAGFYRDLFASLNLPLANQELHRYGSVTQQIISDLMKKNLVITPQGDNADNIRRFCFSARYHTLTLRNLFYDNPYIQFLYLLHELGHIATLQARPNAPMRKWAREIERNELFISCMTEAFIYFDIPSLRAHTFKGEIWVDKYLQNLELLSDKYASNSDFFKTDKTGFFNALFFRYVRTYSKHPSKAFNENERWMIYYREKTAAWQQIWKDDYQQVEHMIHQFRNNKLSADDYLKWLDSITQNNVLFLEHSRKYIEAHATFNPAQPSLLERRDVEFGISLSKRLKEHSEELKARSTSNRLTMTPLVNPTINTVLKGVTATVYSLFSPEIKTLAISSKTENMDHSIHENAAERRQDEFHIRYLEAYAKFVAPVVNGLATFKYQYPTNGASEALKDILARYRVTHEGATMHVFKGEYEGAVEYAKALRYTIIKHDRLDQGDYSHVFKACKPGDLFYLSQPSALDGNVWPDYDSFVYQANLHQVRLVVDLAYVGTVAKPYHIDVENPTILAVVASLSKIGPYYMRIGYSFSREPQALTTANQWFKNLDSEALAIKITTELGVYDLAKTYQPYQAYLIRRINSSQQATDALALMPSDVFMIATQKTDLDKLPADYSKLIREHGFLRACLTTGISSMLDCEKDLHYSAIYRRQT